MICENLNSGLTLDFGSADGNLHKFLLQNPDIEVIGVDISKNENVDVVHNLDKMPYPFPSNYAENIVAGEVIEHLENPLAFLKECFRILKQKGVLIITTPNMTGLQHFLYSQKPERRHTHLYSWGIKNFKNLVGRTKFKIRKIELFTAYWNRNIFYRIVTYLIPQLRTSLFIVLEK
ncbi:MAG: class I SAM-dependent methyltransferase [Candidatus Bathyarchaeota archaeon]|nr:class I SAM-dependent methyltransferase [Candidatus Bathyarchaeota archaeon]